MTDELRGKRIAILATGRGTRRSAIPFGPWMLAGAWTGILAGDALAEAGFTPVEPRSPNANARASTRAAAPASTCTRTLEKSWPRRRSMPVRRAKSSGCDGAARPSRMAEAMV